MSELTYTQNYHISHKEYYLKKYKEWRLKHPEKCSEYTRKYREKVKKDIIDMLGGECVNCGYVGLALQIDHINGGGGKEKTIHGKWLFAHILRELKAGSKDYQLLCANCNYIKRLTSPNERGGRLRFKYIPNKIIPRELSR